MNRMMGMCFNRNVAIGLAAVGLGLLVIAPNLALAALPFLLLAACPLSMLAMAMLMGRGMRQGRGAPQRDYHYPQSAAANTPAPEDHLDQLRMQLHQVQEQQAAIARQVAELEQSQQSKGPQTTLEPEVVPQGVSPKEEHELGVAKAN